MPSIELRNAGSYWKLNYLPITTQSVNDKTWIHVCKGSSLNPKLVNRRPQTKPRLLSTFLSRVLLEHSHPIYFHIVIVLSYYKDRAKQLPQRPSGSQGWKYLLPGPLWKRAADLDSSWQVQERSLKHKLTNLNLLPGMAQGQGEHDKRERYFFQCRYFQFGQEGGLFGVFLP